MATTNTLSSFSDSHRTSDKNNPYQLITKRVDSARIRNHHKRDIEVNISVTSEININKETPVRAGGIIYTHHHGKTYFCLGIDTQSGNLTDFGGGVKKEETIVEGGLRELEEESQGVFGTLIPDDVKNTTTYHSYNMAIMFIPMEVDPQVISDEFERKIVGKINPEVCGIVWLDTQELLESIHGRGKKLYVRVRRLLNKVTTAITEL